MGWFIGNSPAEEVSQNFQGFNLQGYTKSGDKAWDVNSDTAQILGSEVKLTNVDANAYGEQKVNIKAKNGIIDKASGNMQLKEDVIITTETGETLTTEKLNWERSSDLVHTDEEVTITNERMTAVGKGAQIRPNLKVAQMNEDVTVKVQTEPQSPQDNILTITSDGPMEMDQAKKMVTFRENVVALMGDRRLDADEMVIYFDDAMRQIKELICTGNVLVTQGENKSFSQQAIYRAADQKLLLIGKPQLTIVTEGEGSIQMMQP